MSKELEKNMETVEPAESAVPAEVVEEVKESKVKKMISGAKSLAKKHGKKALVVAGFVGATAVAFAAGRKSNEDYGDDDYLYGGDSEDEADYVEAEYSEVAE